MYQTAVNYVNPQWIDIGKDLVAMFSGAMTPEDVLKNVDQRRAEMAKTAKDPAWSQVKPTTCSLCGLEVNPVWCA